MENVTGFPRIEPLAFVALQFTFLAVAIIAAVSRTVLRIVKFQRFALDDVFLVLATVFFTATTVVIYELRTLSYIQMEASLGLVNPPPLNFGELMARFSVLDNVATILVWATIYSVKLSFLTFFKKLVHNVRFLPKLWWFVLSVVVVTAPIAMFLGFYICSDMSPDLLQVCTIKGLARREATYLIVTTSLDIFTDVLVISIPIALLWRVKIDLRRKLALGIVLCLSVVMIVVSIVRVSLAPIYSPVLDQTVPDSVWLFFWQNLEAAIAIIMVSVTAFRSMLGQEPRPSHGSYLHYGSHSDKKAAALSASHWSEASGGQNARMRGVEKEEIGAPVPSASVVTPRGTPTQPTPTFADPQRNPRQHQAYEMMPAVRLGEESQRSKGHNQPESFV